MPRVTRVYVSCRTLGAHMAADGTTVKASWNGDTRRFRAAPDTTLKQLREMLAQRFGAEVEGVHLSWEDGDGDSITVGTEEDLAEAIRCTTGTLRLLLGRVRETEPPGPQRHSLEAAAATTAASVRHFHGALTQSIRAYMASMGHPEGDQTSPFGEPQ